MRWEKHVEAASGEQAVDPVEIAEWITARRRAPMDTLRPAAETTDTDWVGIDNLDVVTCRSQHTQEFACRQTGTFGEQDPRAHMASGWPSPFLVPLRVLRGVELEPKVV